MPKSQHFSLHSSSVEDTIEVGKALGSRLKAGDLVCLNGDLGAGKTHFVKGIATALGIASEQISSPTYTLIAEHHNGALPLYHMDAYRIENLSELGPIGFDDYLSRADGILVIEWSDRITDSLPPDRLDITIVADEQLDQADSRSIDIQAYGDDSISLAEPVTKARIP